MPERLAKIARNTAKVQLLNALKQYLGNRLFNHSNGDQIYYQLVGYVNIQN